MNTLTAFAILALAGAIHASFQLSISVLTLLSSHSIGQRHSRGRLTLLTHAFVFGAGTATLLAICTCALIVQQLLHSMPLDLAWTVLCGAITGIAASVLLFYYRREKGTMLWVPRNFARFLGSRAKATKHSAEAFALGTTSVLAELLFIAAPLSVASIVLAQLNPQQQLVGVFFYTLVSLSSLLWIHTLISGGYSISRLQRWREENKRFLQFASACALLVLGFYMYVEQVLTVAVWAAEKAL